MRLSYDTFETPVGEFTLAMADDLTVRFGLFDGDEGRKAIPGVSEWVRSPQRVQPAIRQLKEYAAGKLDRFTVKLAPQGTPFQQRVWNELLNIPYGQSRSYADIARALGSSPRAVGGAIGSNPICILIPCHRVVAANGQLTGFAWGIERKVWLRQREGLHL